MTENEALKITKLFRDEWDRNSKTKNAEALDIAIQALEEIQQYRAIGTVEEFKVLKKKNDPNKINSFSGCIHNNIEQDWDFAK